MINIFINKKLKTALEKNSIDINDYIPAYNGESAGLDLFNANEAFYGLEVIMAAYKSSIEKSIISLPMQIEEI